MNTYLGVATHFDDEMGFSGRAAKKVSEGNRVVVMYMSSSGAGKIGESTDEVTCVRRQEVTAALKILGIDPETDARFTDLPDGYLGNHVNELIEAIASQIRALQPDELWLPNRCPIGPGLNHGDHEAVHHAGLEAFRRAKVPYHQEYGPEPWRVSRVLGYEIDLNSLSVPPYQVEDITDSYGRKIESLREHASQVGPVPYDDIIGNLNRLRGATMLGAGKIAECYTILR